MKSATPNSLNAMSAAFTVCADEELSALALSAGAYVQGIEFAGNLADYLHRERRPHFPPVLKRADSCIALIDFDRDWQRALDTTETLAHFVNPPIHCIGISSHLEMEGVLAAMRAGCSEFLTKPVQPSTLHQCLERWQNRAALKHQGTERHGRVVTLFGTKGGVGVTALAVHLATDLAARSQTKILLVDHQPELGHVALYLNLKSTQYHFDDLVRNLGRLDSDLLQGFVLTHTSGLHVLASPSSASESTPCSGPQLEQILDFLRSHYDLILIDSSLALREITSTLMNVSDELVLVAAAELASIRDLSTRLDQMRAAGVLIEKIRVVLNRVSSRNVITAEEAAKAIRLPVTLTIPDHAPVANAIGTGEPLSSKRRSDFMTAIGKWAGQLVPPEAGPTSAAAAKKRFGLWR